MKHYRLAVIPADGIGPEVISSSVQVLKALEELHGGVSFEFQDFDWGSARYLATGSLMPKNGLKDLEEGGFSGILLGRSAARTSPITSPFGVSFCRFARASSNTSTYVRFGSFKG